MCSAGPLALAMPEVSLASLGNNVGEDVVLHDNPLGGAWHDNPLGGSTLSSATASPMATPRPPRLLLPGNAATATAPSSLVRFLAGLH